MEHTGGKRLFYRNNEVHQISSIEFGMMTASEIEAQSSLQVSNLELYVLPERRPAPYGCLDNRLGVFQKTDTCGTCHEKLDKCSGSVLFPFEPFIFSFFSSLSFCSFSTHSTSKWIRSVPFGCSLRLLSICYWYVQAILGTWTSTIRPFSTTATSPKSSRCFNASASGALAFWWANSRLAASSTSIPGAPMT